MLKKFSTRKRLFVKKSQGLLSRIKSKAKAASLIEVLIVIAIIAILAAAGLSSFTTAQAKGRDGQRKTDFNQLSRALEMYHNDYRSYPPSSDGKIMAGGVVLGWGEEFKDEQETIYMKKLPKENKGPDFCYKTDESREKYAIFSVLENKNDPKYSYYCSDKSYSYYVCDNYYNYVAMSQGTSIEAFGAVCKMTEEGVPPVEPTPTSVPTSPPVLTSTPRPTNTPTATPSTCREKVYTGQTCSQYQFICRKGPNYTGECTQIYANYLLNCSDGTYIYGCVGNGGYWYNTPFDCYPYGNPQEAWCSGECIGSWTINSVCIENYTLYPSPTPTPIRIQPSPTPRPTSTPLPCPTGTCQTIQPGCSNYCSSSCQVSYGPACPNNPVPGTSYIGCGCRSEGEQCGGVCPSVMCCDGLGCGLDWKCR